MLLVSEEEKREPTGSDEAVLISPKVPMQDVCMVHVERPRKGFPMRWPLHRPQTTLARLQRMGRSELSGMNGEGGLGSGLPNGDRKKHEFVGRDIPQEIPIGNVVVSAKGRGVGPPTNHILAGRIWCWDLRSEGTLRSSSKAIEGFHRKHGEYRLPRLSREEGNLPHASGKESPVE